MPVDRIAAARERLNQASAIAWQARGAGPPCSACRFKTLIGNCANPVYAEPHFRPHSGVYEEMFHTPVATARNDDGLCGPEAVLFEPLDLPAVVGKAVWLGAKTVWLGAIAIVFVVLLLGR